MSWLEINFWTIIITFLYFNIGFFYSLTTWKTLEKSLRLTESSSFWILEINWRTILMFPWLYQSKKSLTYPPKTNKNIYPFWETILSDLPKWSAFNNFIFNENLNLYLQYSLIFWPIRLFFHLLGLISLAIGSFLYFSFIAFLFLAIKFANIYTWPIQKLFLTKKEELTK